MLILVQTNLELRDSAAQSCGTFGPLSTVERVTENHRIVQKFSTCGNSWTQTAERPMSNDPMQSHNSVQLGYKRCISKFALLTCGFIWRPSTKQSYAKPAGGTVSLAGLLWKLFSMNHFISKWDKPQRGVFKNQVEQQHTIFVYSGGPGESRGCLWLHQPGGADPWPPPPWGMAHHSSDNKWRRVNNLQ